MASTNPLADTHAQRSADYERFKNYAAYTFLIATPVIIALPPRRLDPLAILLVSAFAVSANHITEQKTGRSIVERVESRISRSQNVLPSLPSERAQELQAQMRAARDAQIKEGSLVGDELEKLKARQRHEQGIASRVWMGGETEGWKERRLREEQKALDEGKGYGDLIQEYIWDVWSWGKKSDDEDDE
ncbi:hypothetical protein N7495_006370 [Penicillium taxi]|uniref:uncharacterized protein n=1 Tax=Penicillium taxi TaxID=168475 RepID=UPI002544E408|nr:uncharacterized protein N7495_006370 [Penicillium taxi]KAJ5894679.1 hypothetical protein N7495_006370 [Penicillium taxi]